MVPLVDEKRPGVQSWQFKLPVESAYLPVVQAAQLAAEVEGPPPKEVPAGHETQKYSPNPGANLPRSQVAQEEDMGEL